jgi:exopolysaccharide biosynthesis polyprenyl glycosylphosphotransferase
MKRHSEERVRPPTWRVPAVRFHAPANGKPWYRETESMRRREPFTGRRYLLAAVDAAVAFFAVSAVMGGSTFLVMPVAGWAAVVCVAVLNMTSSYTHIMRKPISVHQYSAGVAAALSISCGIFLLHLGGESVHRAEVGFAALLLFLCLLVFRLSLVAAHRYLIRPRRLWVIAKDGFAARHFAAKVERQGCSYEVHRCSGPVDQDEFAKELMNFDSVMCPPSMRGIVEPACNLLQKELLLVPDSADVLLHAAAAHQLDDLLVLSIKPLQLTVMRQALKRGLDIAGAVLLLTLFAPLIAIVYLLVPLESDGPALFRQERRGIGGRSFKVLKFRTMLVNAEKQSGPVLATVEDPRVTVLGRWLRASRFDELPQLFNVLRGDMSLVGPRPEREYFARQFDQELPNYRLRTVIKPGLTGLAQVWGRYSTTAEDKLRLDLMYIANHSLGLDINLLLQTVRVVLHHRQSAGIDPANHLTFGLHSVSIDDSPKL